jgi:hypothetical protein
VLIFSFFLFFGEWLIDLVINGKRESLRIEIRDSILTSIIVGILVVIGNNSLK